MSRNGKTCCYFEGGFFPSIACLFFRVKLVAELLFTEDDLVI